MSAFGAKADVDRTCRDVRLGPIADMSSEHDGDAICTACARNRRAGTFLGVTCL
jgi:hypothetical protein